MILNINEMKRDVLITLNREFTSKNIYEPLLIETLEDVIYCLVTTKVRTKIELEILILDTVDTLKEVVNNRKTVEYIYLVLGLLGTIELIIKELEDNDYFEACQNMVDFSNLLTQKIMDEENVD